MIRSLQKQQRTNGQGLRQQGSMFPPQEAEHHAHDNSFGLGGWAAVTILTLVLAVLIRALIFQSYKIPSESMVPTLVVGDHILVSKLGYGYRVPGIDGPIFRLRAPQRFDVVVFRNRQPEVNDEPQPEHFIKRIVGLPGETVEVRDFEVSVNGKRMIEYDHIITSRNEITNELHRGDFGPITLKKGEYFVLGDNRINSKDSRFFGPIRDEDLEGRAFLIYWSWIPNRSFKVRWDRIWKKIQ